VIDRILLDMDGVLVDFLGGCKKFHGKEYKWHPHQPDKQTEQTSWNIEPVFQMQAKEIWDPLGFEFWANLEPHPWMQEIVTLLEDRFGDKNICLLTAPIETYGAIDGKRAWIRKHLPQFRRRYLVASKPSRTRAGTPSSSPLPGTDASTSTRSQRSRSGSAPWIHWRGRTPNRGEGSHSARFDRAGSQEAAGNARC
jgi:5'(3')-deoxyribonucleotidase